jgi:predicted PurR-regulated permease PerM
MMSITTSMTIEGSPFTISNDTGSVFNQTANQVLQNLNQTANQVLQNLNQTANQVLQNMTVGNVTQTLQNIKGNLTVVNQTASEAATQAVQIVRKNITSEVKNALSDFIPQKIQDLLILVFLIIAIPLILNLILVFVRRMMPPPDNKKNRLVDRLTNRENTDFYRALMTFGLILIVGLLVFFLIGIISVNVDKPQNDSLTAIINIVQNLAAILGTALASVIAFYFGLRASTAQRAATTTGTSGPTTGTSGPTTGTSGPTTGTSGPTTGTSGPTTGTSGPTTGKPDAQK